MFIGGIQRGEEKQVTQYYYQQIREQAAGTQSRGWGLDQARVTQQ